MTSEPGRRLIWVPIIHSAEDLGTLQGPVRRLVEQSGGPGRWQQHVGAIGRHWRTIREEILRLDVDWPRARIYQDGLPVCGHEERIVQDLARSGSPNHRLILELMARGARLTGTESPGLLLEEYERNRRLLAERTPAAPTPDEGGEGPARRLLELRDEFIARRIDETLGPGETGCLFLGLLHSLEGRLPADIALVRAGPLAAA